MKTKIYLTLLLSIAIIFTSKPCGGDGGEWYGYDYSGLILSQELINSPEYFPFLLSLGEPFYTNNDSTAILQNGNILEWSKYLNIDYNDAYYLVFKATDGDIEALLKKNKSDNAQLRFADKSFVSKYKEALTYLLLAKQLEPFMRISEGDNSSWYSYEDVGNDITNLPYTENSLSLQKLWKKTKDKELKLRYGYQLVRLAHYNRDYEEAVAFFDNYVEPLNYKPEMYYYALSQKAGALRGLDQVIEANKLFTEVFSHSQDLKETAVTSIRFNENIDYENILAAARTTDEKNDADLLVGFISFSNPLASAAKIIKRSPDAIQAKVLVARAIADLDFNNYGRFTQNDKRRFPILDNNSEKNIPELTDFIKKQADSPDVKNKSYWNITLAYLYFVQQQFDQAEQYLTKVNQSEKVYKIQKAMLANYIDIARIPIIDANAENQIFEKYINKSGVEGYDIIIRILANRYYLQKEYAKSFMLTCTLNELMDNPNMALLNDIETFYNAPNKSKMDTYICDKFRTGLDSKSVSVPQLAQYMRGIFYLSENKLTDAKSEFDKSNFSLDTIPANIFGYNQIECFTCEGNMTVDYLNEFPYINEEMNEKQLVEVLIKLEKQANENNAKANYLLGNFFYNTSLTGYFRNFLRFGYEGGYRQQFFDPRDKNSILTDYLYFNGIPTYYDNNTTSIADTYLKKAYALAKGDEFKAQIVFALSKCEQELNYQKLSNSFESWSGTSDDEDWVMITNRKYFKEMMKYKNTNFFKQVQSNCLYFDYYVSHL